MCPAHRSVSKYCSTVSFHRLTRHQQLRTQIYDLGADGSWKIFLYKAFIDWGIETHVGKYQAQ
jgi:hypothetical protein